MCTSVNSKKVMNSQDTLFFDTLICGTCGLRYLYLSSMFVVLLSFTASRMLSGTYYAAENGFIFSCSILKNIILLVQFHHLNVKYSSDKVSVVRISNWKNGLEIDFQ